MMENNLSQTHNSQIGFVTGGGLEANLQVRLTVPPQSVQEGALSSSTATTGVFMGW